MLALDTNVIVRFLTNDDPRQAAKARTLIERQRVFACTTVLLEAEWVLRTVYTFACADVVRAFRAFAGLPTVFVEDEQVLRQALDWTDAGLDFADAVHLAKSTTCEAFVTFDRALVKTARRLGAGNARLA